MFTLFSGRHIGRLVSPPTWRLHTRSTLHFCAEHFDEYLNFRTTTHLKLGELSSWVIVYNITMSWPYPMNGFFFYFLLRDNEHTRWLTSRKWSLQEASIISYHKGISQKHHLHLQTVGFVQACQHFLDRSQIFLSVQSPTEPGGCTFPNHSLVSKPQDFIDPRQQYHFRTTGIHSRARSSAGGWREKPGSFT